MKTMSFLIIGSLVALTSIHTFAEESEIKDITGFNSFEFGVTLDYVEKNLITPDMVEGIDYYRDVDKLSFMGESVAGYDCFTQYLFQNYKFVRGSYLLTEEHSNDYKYYEDHYDLAEKVDSLYGHAETKELWSNDLFKGDWHKEGTAILSGHLTLLTQWFDSDSDMIGLITYGDNYKNVTMLMYQSANYESKANTDGL